MSWKRGQCSRYCFPINSTCLSYSIFFISELDINGRFPLTLVRHMLTGEKPPPPAPQKKNKKGERSINNPYRVDLWLTNELPSHPSELSVPYIIGDILGSPDRCGYARSCSRFPIILRYLSGRFLRRDASRSSLTFSFDASRAHGRGCARRY